MSEFATDYSLAELLICANAAAYDNDGEILVTGIGVLPRIAASLAMKTSNTDIMMTDSEAWLLSEPNPVGNRPDDFIQKNETWMGFSRIFDNVWSGCRHYGRPNPNGPFWSKQYFLSRWNLPAT